MSAKLDKAIGAMHYMFGSRWFEDEKFYRAKESLRGRLGGPVFIHPQDNELLAFIDGEMHRADIG